ncbi:hypothetical protein EW146_g4712 [Bondarzewia mesenterica]|uniref:Uncharacterized protein n=1 Tax=Bondarzewia mesenterica TaxID=1095465 RepID=A0A4S4LVJ6_9AGAM|nr:hypothetical protein EW146_g4712 [Bondarzewia mesenterica]
MFYLDLTIADSHAATSHLATSCFSLYQPSEPHDTFLLTFDLTLTAVHELQTALVSPPTTWADAQRSKDADT